MRSLHLFLLAAILLPTVFAQEGDLPSVRAERTTEAPTLDGLVTEEFWSKIPAAGDFTQRNPDETQPSTERTEVRFAFDEDNLYIGIICFDSEPDQIVLTQNRRDGELNNTDSVQILLDTFGDRQLAVIFGTTPTGIEFDAQVSKAGQSRGGGGPPRSGGGGGGGGAQQGGAASMNLNWDAVWTVQSQITQRGWESEMQIPFNTLRYKPGSDLSWGLNIVRNIRRRNEDAYWSPISRAFTLSQLELAGSLNGIEAETHRNLQLLPYVVGGVNRDFQAVDQTDHDLDAGLDVKYTLTPTLTLDATVNTDFAQVEVDDEQINLTRFSLFFPEKRPFFLENSGIFEFGSPREAELFFSRRIGLDAERNAVPIDVGIRLSGKIGKYQVGLLDMQTRQVDDRAPGNNYAVARVSRELANRSSIGVIAINREATSSITNFPDQEDNNRSFGVDANFGIGAFGNLFNYYAKTKTPGLRGGDHAAASSFGYDDALNDISLGYLEVGRNFNPEVGFVRRVGLRKPSFGYRRRFFPNSGWIRSIEPHFSVNQWFTIESNDKESDFQHFHFTGRLQDGGQFGAAFNRSFERLDQSFEVNPGTFIASGRYRFSEAALDYSTDPSKVLFFQFDFAKGQFYDGDLLNYGVQAGFRPSAKLSWIGTYAKNKIDLPSGSFDTDLVGLRFNCSFTPKSYLQAFSQYNSVTRQIGHNIRFALLSTSSTGLFVVYNTAHATYEFNDPHGVDRRLLSQALIIKFNHLINY
ncbi:MAG: DUF5916 domain-containing protein [Acidobacteria bacterium]|nr:DUF5916 domain-containing protein [Acidobacteriota bacterium]MDA1235432.1 DUF5916 domain-containing protein [Acidobacteriota bacterium]